jgi:alkylhydroperoxidase family enzyme
VEIWAYRPKMMMGMGKFNQAVRKGKSVDERIKNLVELKGAQMVGCEFCVDLGSQICRNSGFSDDELLALAHYRHSGVHRPRVDRFNAAFRIGSAGFSEGMVCVSPDRAAANPAPTSRFSQRSY